MIRVSCADAFDVVPVMDLRGCCLVWDPPWDLAGAWELLYGLDRVWGSLLVFVDPPRLGDVVLGMGLAPSWVFVWDTMNTWSRSRRQPVRQSKMCAWWGDHFDRDAVLWGSAPPVRDHPTTKQQPLGGRRLTDIHRSSLRWLHNPRACGVRTLGTSRFGSERAGDEVWRHAKPLPWVRCLIGCTSAPGTAVVDPFCGSGTSLLAAQDLGRSGEGLDVSDVAVSVTRDRLRQGVLFGGEYGDE